MAGTAFIAVPVFKPEVMYASDFQSIEADKLRIINDLEEKHNLPCMSCCMPLLQVHCFGGWR